MSILGFHSVGWWGVLGGVNMGVGLGRCLVLMVWPVGVTHCSLMGDIFCLLLAANGFVSSSFFAIVGDRLGVVVDDGLVFVVLLSLLVVAVAVAVVVLAVVVSGLGRGVGLGVAGIQQRSTPVPTHLPLFVELAGLVSLAF